MSVASAPTPTPDRDYRRRDRVTLLDGSRFRDQGRLQSSEITRAFSSALRAIAQGPQSEAWGPVDVMLEPDGAISDAGL